MPSSDSFDAFRENLARRLEQAQSIGASRGTILNAAKDVAEWLSAEVRPTNPEQRLLKELWDVSDDRERNSLTNVLVKFVDRTPK
jgi:disulfide oxidoreductase YuzD